MGLFSSVLGGAKSFPTSEPEAVIGLLMSVIAADGEISDDERDSFMYLANKTKSLGPMPADAFWEHVDTCRSILRREGAPALMEKCALKISAEKREPIFINSCDLIMRDGRVDPDEETLIEALAKRLSIDDAVASSIVGLILSKYRL